jgi:hypothetical protein
MQQGKCMDRRRAAAFVFALGLALSGPTAGRALAAETPTWSEIKWPFAIDQWGTGRAFRCTAAECGVAADLYLRPKIGFCNCATGVADDDDVDRVGDVDILGNSFVALGPGKPVAIGWMKGRSRSYLLTGQGLQARFTLAIAYADKCDVVVATVVVVAGRPAAAEAAALAFLNGAPALDWVKAQLGL